MDLRIFADHFMEESQLGGLRRAGPESPEELSLMTWQLGDG